jgi:hypothetical protein
MFYKKQDIDSVLACSICAETFRDNDPRMLPCGQTACHVCISNCIDVKNEFVCAFCHQTHQVPTENGFPPNLAIQKMIQLKPGYVQRNANAEKLTILLDELKQASDRLKFNMANSVDQIKEKSNELRSQVNSQTEVLLDQVRQFNLRLISEIDQYENQCMNSFNQKIAPFSEETNKHLSQVNAFCETCSSYFTEFKLSNEQAKRAITLAEKHVDRIKQLDFALKKIAFNGKFVAFKKSELRLDSSLLGSLSQGFDTRNINEILASSLRQTETYEDVWGVLDVWIFKTENDTNAVFYMNASYHFNMTVLDAQNHELSHVSNLFRKTELKQIKMAKMDTNYVIYVYSSFSHYPFSFNERSIFLGNQNEWRHMFLIVDKDLNYVTHKVLNVRLAHIAANVSKLICFDSSNTLYFYDSNLNLAQESTELQQNIDQTIVDVKMNEKHLFVLCTASKLKIFELNSFDFVRETRVDGDQIRLISSDYLAVFNKSARMLYVHKQDGGFEKENETSLAIGSNAAISQDCTRYISFCSFCETNFRIYNDTLNESINQNEGIRFNL